MVESAMFDRAINGVERMKFNPKTGEPYIDPRTGEPYVERHWPESTAQFLLKSLPEYGGKQDIHNHGGQETNVAAIIAEIKQKVPGWEEACDKKLLDAYNEELAKADARLLESNGHSVVQGTKHSGNGASYESRPEPAAV